MGSPWEVRILQDIQGQIHLEKDVITILDDFDATYSRFSPHSLVTQLAHTSGKVVVPNDLVTMLRHYARIYIATQHKVNPLVGGSIEDLGYDAHYSLQPKKDIRSVPLLETAITILDDTTLEIHKPSLIDIGAVGKGYAVKLVADYLEAHGITAFLINGSGDLLQKGPEPITVGLENPFNTDEAIGTIQLHNASLGSSGSNRRKWGNLHHIIDPDTLASPNDIAATWVITEDPALADLLSTAIFLVHPDTLLKQYDFEWLIVSSQHHATYSKGFIAELF